MKSVGSREGQFGNSEKWATQQLVIGRIGHASLRQDIELPPDQNYRKHKYETLALSYFANFAQAASTVDLSHSDPSVTDNRTSEARRMSHSGSTRVGFEAMGYLLYYGVSAYKSYCDTNDLIPSLGQLESTLKHRETEKRFLTWFANVPNDVNRIREEVFGLRPFSFNPNPEMNAFICRPDRNGNLHIGPDTRMYIEAVNLTNMDQLVIDENNESTERCPAHDVFLPKLWREMVVSACTIPEFAAADLGLVTVE